MSSKRKNSSSLHLLLKSAVVLFILTFLVDFQLNNNSPVWLTALLAATFVGISIIIFLINYTDFQKFGFLPVIAISAYEIYNHAFATTYQGMIETFYYISVIFIGLYFVLRVKKKKYQSRKR